MDVSARLTSKGQVTIPRSVREALGLGDGDHVVFRVEGHRAVLARTPDLLDLAGAVEVPAEKRVNIICMEELLETKANVVGTACPFCLAMVDLGRKVKEAEGTVQVKDISELVADSLE